MSRLSGPRNFLLPQMRPQSHAAPSGLEAPPVSSWFRIENADNSDTADVYIFDEIIGGSMGWLFGGVSAEDVIEQIKGIKSGTINVHINSPGGEVFEGVAIYNSLVQHQAKVITKVEGLAASAAAMVAQAGDEIEMSVGSMMMIHDASALAYGNAQDMLDIADLLDKTSQNIAGLFSMRAGESSDFWREFMKNETWYTAQEAVDANLADRVSGNKRVEPENKWFKSFAYAGRGCAPSPLEVKSHVLNTLKETPVSGTPKAGDKPSQATAPESQQTTEPEAQPTTPQNVAVQPVMIDGKPVTDAAAIQSHVNTLENFRRDTQAQNRRDFVAQLVRDKKILASQVGDDENAGVEAFALSLDPTAYAAWQKTWDAAPANPLTQRHTGAPTSPEDEAPEDAKLKQQIEDARATVKMHKDGGMKDAALEKTESYKLLKKHNAL